MKRFAGWTDGQMRKAHQGLAALEAEYLAGYCPMHAHKGLGPRISQR